jgi:hypothetical protein
MMMAVNHVMMMAVNHVMMMAVNHVMTHDASSQILILFYT